jgi:hypothetical protein
MAKIVDPPAMGRDLKQGKRSILKKNLKNKAKICTIVAD